MTPELDKYQAAARLLAELPEQERKRLHHEQFNQRLFDEEHNKCHTLTSLTWTPEQIEDFCSHLLDGGGVVDDAWLCRHFVSAIRARDMQSICHLMPHVIKAWLKIRGHLEPPQPGSTGVVLHGGDGAVSPSQYKALPIPKEGKS